MNKIELTAPCGLDCFNCPLYEGNITEEYKKRSSEYLGIPLEDTPCRGCRGEKGHFRSAVGSHCATWDCVQEKRVTYCYECAGFPCKLLMPTQQGAQFPHNMKVYNLCRMRFLGVDKWIEESSEIRKRYFEGRFEVGKGPVLENDTI
ncbi:MAG: DUF3795 domain-containing protein [Candidatus Azobacteroides sp.]|nr:DUF3795 domain-containing protein [Candidatus Azobacteroides sp.]